MFRKNRSAYLSLAILAICSLAFLPQPNPNLEDALVGHWTFDQEKGETVSDNSIYASHGKIQGELNRATGIIGDGALEFDGHGGYVEILENGKTPLQLQELDQGSISIWFKARNIPIKSSILPILYYGNKNGCDNMKDASNEGLVIEIAHGGIFKKSQGVFFTIFNNPCELPSICFDSHSDRHAKDTQGIIEEQKWYHFVAVVGEDFNTGYLNGEEITYRRYNFSGAHDAQFFQKALKHERLWIGKGYWDHGKEVYFDGHIDDLRVYNKALSQTEVLQLYDMRKKY